MDMVSSLFEKALKIESPWEVKRIELNEKDKSINIYIDFPKGSPFSCPRCKSLCKAYDTKEIRLRHLDFFQYRCYLIIRLPRIECKEDGILQIEIPWARPQADFTLLFESFAMILLREMPVNTVSRIIGVDDNKLWRMVHYYVDKARTYEEYADVSSIGIDETSMKKGHNYITLVVDLEKKKTIFVTHGKDTSTIEEFKKDLLSHNGSPFSIKVATIDMSPAYISGINEHFPHTEITFDRFHLMKIINSAVDEVRKKELKEQDILRGTRYLWLKNRSNLTKAQKDTLKEIESMPGLNIKTIKAFHIRENSNPYTKSPLSVILRGCLKDGIFGQPIQG
jgi:transposase